MVEAGSYGSSLELWEGFEEMGEGVAFFVGTWSKERDLGLWNNWNGVVLRFGDDGIDL